MATILDTLKDIETLQAEIEPYSNLYTDTDRFIREIMNFTSVMYFEFSSHAVLNSIKLTNYKNIRFGQKYFDLYLQDGLLDEFIRLKNIGYLSVIWNIYEKYLRDKYRNDYSLEEFKIKKLFDDLLPRMFLPNSARIIEEFEVIRNTRNSLHDGGIYGHNFTPFRGFLQGNEYIFTPGDKVTLLRIMDVAKTIWSHFKLFENI